ncbi:UDP-N-acetyl-D-mannosamine dehydrogenase [Brachybacterium saurashtrense]|uniref:UDP-N-acetyl-D-mannosamine dehydrogenase n=1 Tax=Brachybacterium saurashtrense TaxID=556288 RepID=A0A345YQJ4_9MICO|nr:UDP-N-acetyl-D-mannosamine dehydrogenase [Brachybacterium saurashtrense]AXK46196.1 UDP-N-acetyl-D-mannosamine dehydrogenase [Brachybacterium saurashtrense]RRR23936.1 UDP-N-acetyl-D-mannosamine dehydrogenase [Brachybacterium saurashtrense]
MSPNVPLDTVAVIGLGYIGLPTAAVLAQAGRTVIGVDIKQSTVEAINAGTVPFVEEGLETVVAGAVAQGKLSAQTETPEADVYIVSVPTPFKGDHDADLSYIEAAAKGIAPKLTGGELVVLESTAPPGATERMADVILEARPEFTKEANLPNSLYFSHAPERVLPGRIMIEMVDNDRIIGGLTPEASQLNRDLYASFCKGELLLTNARTAEMAKLTENAFRDVNIAFANELSLIADRQGIDVWELIELANHHPRVNILQPGPGVGGHCIAVDPWFIVSADREQSHLIRTAREVNDAKPEAVLQKVLAKADKLKNPVVAALGIAFKADIDDLRESPSKDIAVALSDRLEHGTVLVTEPNIDALPGEFADKDNVELTDLEDAIQRADIVLLLVDHAPFKDVDREALREKVVIDTKGLWR